MTQQSYFRHPSVSPEIAGQKPIGAIDLYGKRGKMYPFFGQQKKGSGRRAPLTYWDGSLTICWKVVMKIVQFKIWTLRLSILHTKKNKKSQKVLFFTQNVSYV